ncbi:hypothetical protein [Nostoc sp. 'Peltigera malacea cyanobiont' DB3992]|uniref:hypothetical protein n=1 Tax=Nostoc sp. 'Peltigera malacea cyanobiont' DB3992 TaxID=1206980 RepID=UPI000C048A17|nr:hypothetical protein [Nostoc sp. 'Peltigera malacea cyanobiont' DB3992]PHM09041.1 hypothetical protein CK516_17035 [Nostoc sp. 'Peltigera malacea cyanobiont' DB3992]
MEISNSTPQRDIPQLQASERLVQAKSINRREFMKLPLEERRCILAAQAELMLLHYEQDREWQELQTGDLIDY